MEKSGAQKFQFNSVQSLSRIRLFATSWVAALQASLSITNSNSCTLSQWCHSTISSSVIPSLSCPQSFPASGSFPVSQIFISGGQSIGVSASISVLPKNIQDWFPLGWTGWISLKTKGFSRLFSQHHSSKASILSCSAFFMSNSHTHTWLLEKPYPWLDRPFFWQSKASAF